MNEKVIQFEKNHTINHLLVYISQQMLSPLKSAKCYVELLEKESLTKRQLLQLNQAKNELSQAESFLDHYLTVMDEKFTEQKEMSFVKELQGVVLLNEIVCSSASSAATIHIYRRRGCYHKR